MYWLYNQALRLASIVLIILSRFRPKIRLFVEGRKHTFDLLSSALPQRKPVIWIHTASLGEFEQGLPVIQQLKQAYPSHTLLVTFFSPSGYEVKKGSREADIISYLPLDTKNNARKFVELVKPEIAIFVKYEVWPNFYRELHRRGVPIVLFSALFRETQPYFNWYGGFLRKSLRLASHIFTQDTASLELLKAIQLENASVSGDTRFDRVSEILKRDNTLSFMQAFKGKSLCLVAGSTWPEDEALLLPLINKGKTRLKFLIAPHDIKREHVERLKAGITKKTVLYTELDTGPVEEAEVLILDTIGLLTKVYHYADVAYVGGGFATGLHNTLEPAAYGVPVLIGPHYQNFREARDLVALGGLLVVKDAEILEENVVRLENDPAWREGIGKRNADYVQEQTGASARIMEYLRKIL